jgi:prevent-host-death family protein
MKLSLKEDINSISYIKSNFPEVLGQIKENHRPMIITQNGKSAGIIIDMDSWEFMMKKIALLKFVNEGEESLMEKGSKSLFEITKSFKTKYEF